MNALLKSNQVNEMEGGTFLDYDQEANADQYYGLDDAVFCAPAFRSLKQLMRRCLEDAVSSGNIYADAMLQHLYRWLCRLVNLDVLVL